MSMRRQDYRRITEILDLALLALVHEKPLEAKQQIEDGIRFLEHQQTIQPGKVRGLPFQVGEDSRRKDRLK